MYKKDSLEDEDLRVCNECGKHMKEGYVINCGEEYYCDDECLHKHITPEERNELFAGGESDSYRTERED